MHIVAIVQARMGSTRLPGKVLKEICGKPILWHLLNRLSYTKLVDKIVVATTKLPEDKIILNFVNNIFSKFTITPPLLKGDKGGFKQNYNNVVSTFKARSVETKPKINTFAGSVNDLLDRYYRAAVKFNADVIVRITADCPLIDPVIVDKVISKYKELNNFDLVGTDETWPDGLDTTVISFSALKHTWIEARLPSEREHVAPFILNRPERFKIRFLRNRINLSTYRWTVDEPKDLLFVKAVYKRLYKDETSIFGMKEIITLLKQEPQLREINRGIVRNEGYLKSLSEDKKVDVG